ncbi:WXG100 family type VII secretion target [Amycolatopsis nivea]|uniref:WXG100 family type VII secretion target n=1 Tax=Amycolatopsis nivea TaxID=1644109 RepID=UPI001430B65D|nr:WXG100 family type VII secretion target [Amycolatopsis nivea]
MSVVEPITDSNNTTGAGAIDSWHSVVSSIQEIQHLHGADAAAVGVEIGVSIVGAIADTAALVLDPFGKLIAAGLGWLIEHISFLKEGLDKLAGDPAAIKKMAEELHKTAQNLRNAAKDLDATLQKTVTDWQGDGAEAFKKNIGDRRGQIDSAGQAVDVAGYVVETTMALVTVVRSLIRDLITTFLGDVIATMLIALAMAAFTFGASIVVGVGNVIRSGISLALTMASKIARVVGLGGRTASRLAQLAEKVKPGRGGGSHGGGNNHEMTDLGGNHGGGHGGGTGGGGGGGGQGGQGGHGGNNTPHDDTPGGNNNHHDDTPDGNNAPHDDTPGGSNTPHDDTPGGSNHHDDTPGGNNTPHDDTPGGNNTPHEDTPGSNTPHDDTPGGNNHHDATPGGNNTPHEERPNNQPHEDDPFDTWLAADQHFNPPPNRPHDTPGGNPHHEDTTGGGGNHENTPGGHDNTPGGNNQDHDTPGGNNTPHDETPGGNNHHDDNPGENQNHETNGDHHGDNAGGNHQEGNAGGNHQEGNAGGNHQETNQGGEHGNTQGEGGGSGRPSGPQSPFKPYDFRWMKKHEDWLENMCNLPQVQKYTGGKNVWKDIVKAPDEYFKTHPKLYPFLKGLADAKSSKNFVGWIGKDAINFDKAITDIHMQAEEAWKTSDEEWRKEHPDPAAEGSTAE